MGFTAKVDLDEFHRGVREHRRQVRRIMRNGVTEAVQAGMGRAKQGQFKDQSGALRRGIYATPTTTDEVGSYAHLIAPEKYASFVEEGTRAHWIRPIDYQDAGGARHTIGRNAGRFVKQPVYGAGRGKFLRFYVNGRAVFAREVYHPGSKPYPFMGPAYQVMESKLVTYLENGFMGLQMAVWDK